MTNEFKEYVTIKAKINGKELMTLCKKDEVADVIEKVSKQCDFELISQKPTTREDAISFIIGAIL